VKPGDYPLRSCQSRAAPRSLLERRFAGRKRLDVVLTSSVPRPGGALALMIGEWQEGADGTLTRFSMIPSGMTIEEAERTSPFRMRCLRRLLVVAAAFLVASGVFTLPARAQHPLHNSDVSVSVFGQFTTTVSGNGITQRTTDSVGGQGAFRHSYHWWLGYEASYNYTRFNEYYTGQPYSYQNNLHDFSGAYLFTAPGLLAFQPFAEVGASALIFSPSLNGGQHASWQARPALNLSFGINQALFTSHFGIRIQYRGLYYKAPDFGKAPLTTGSRRLTTEPMIGMYLRF
jgi:hypothetical protein